MAIQTGALTVYPQAVDDTYSNYPELTNPTNPVGKGSSNTTYAAVWYSAYNAARWTYWPFDLSAIPENAVIDSVTCSATAGYYRESDVVAATLQLYCGDTAKGNETSFAGFNARAVQVDCGSWTRAELKTCGLRVTGRSTGSTATYRRFAFYGADLTVAYTVNSQKFMLKLEGTYTDIARVFQKIDGIWIEQDDLNNVVVNENGLINGGQIESTAPVEPSFTIDGVVYYFDGDMTWKWWVESSYNTGGFTIVYDSYFGEIIYAPNGTQVIGDETYSIVYPDWLIVENHAYMLLNM